MTEFEQCLLMTLKDIKGQLNGISDGLYFIGKHLSTMNDNHDNDWTDTMHNDLEKINDTLVKICDVQAETKVGWDHE